MRLCIKQGMCTFARLPVWIKVRVNPFIFIHFLSEILSLRGNVEIKCSVWVSAAVSGELYNYCWACSVWQWGLGCLTQAALSPTCHHRLVPDAGLTTLAVIKRCKWMPCSSARGGGLKCDERDTNSARTRVKICENVCYSAKRAYFSVATVARLSLLLWWTEEVPSQRRGRGRALESRERQLTFYKKPCIYASVRIQLKNGDKDARGEAGRVCLNVTYLKPLIFDIAVHSSVWVCSVYCNFNNTWGTHLGDSVCTKTTQCVHVWLVTQTFTE